VAHRGGIAGPAEAGQASLELIAGLPVLLLAGLVALQLLATGYSVTLADGAVEAGAIAIAGGQQPQAAVEEALPGWADDRVDLERRGGRLTLRLRPPSPFAAVARALEVSSSAWVREPAETGS
jgi:hypothetical protein